MAKEKASISLDSLPFQVHFSPVDIDDFIQAHGIPFIHYRAMRCPGGLKSKHDARRTATCHLGCSNGFLYTAAGKITCAPSGNSSKLAQYDVGLLTGASLSITPPRHYSDAEGATPRLVQLLQFDRLFLNDELVTVPMWETFEASETGVDRLRFPAIEVMDLVDSQGVRYAPGDYFVKDGKLVWGSRRPGTDPETLKGRVCSVRYTYRPYWVVSTLVHEVRVSTVEDPQTGQLVTARLPQSAVIQREYLFENTDRDENSVEPNNPRVFVQPANGGFSPR